MDPLKVNRGIRDSTHGVEIKAIRGNWRTQVSPSNSEYKITGLSEKPCEDQMLL